MSSERYRLPLRLLLAAGIALVAAQLLRTGIADFLRLEPCAYLDGIQASGRRPDPAKLGSASDQLELARTIDPNNPIIHEYLGIVHFHRAIIVAEDLPIRIGYLEMARDYYAAALKLRPNSGYLWAGMMTICGALLESRRPSAAEGNDISGIEVGDLRGLEQALRHATRLAPWEVPVLNAVLKTGKLHYLALGPADRDLVDAAVLRASQLELDVDSEGSR
jgi:hypothetical protein